MLYGLGMYWFCVFGKARAPGHIQGLLCLLVYLYAVVYLLFTMAFTVALGITAVPPIT